MGSGRWDPGDWKDYTSSAGYDKKTTSGSGGIYSASGMASELNPYGIKGRESCDSDDNPRSTALIVGLDVTGSMGMIADTMARTGLNTLLTEVYTRKPISDPHVMCMGIGDVEAGDSAPLQITQFEADLRIATQLEKLYLEHGGGGNHYESYMLPWYFAAHHTTIDCFEKRGLKGYLFTIGDEQPTPYLQKDDIKRVLGYAPQEDVDRDALLTLVSRKWEVFHVMVAEGSHARNYPDRVRKEWTDLLGQRALWLKDHTKLAEVIVSAIQIVEGARADDVVASWDGSTSMVVRDAVAGLSRRGATAEGLVTL